MTFPGRKNWLRESSTGGEVGRPWVSAQVALGAGRKTLALSVAHCPWLGQVSSWGKVGRGCSCDRRLPQAPQHPAGQHLGPAWGQGVCGRAPSCSSGNRLLEAWAFVLQFVRRICFPLRQGNPGSFAYLCPVVLWEGSQWLGPKRGHPCVLQGRRGGLAEPHCEPAGRGVEPPTQVTARGTDTEPGQKGALLRGILCSSVERGPPRQSKRRLRGPGQGVAPRLARQGLRGRQG